MPSTIHSHSSNALATTGVFVVWDGLSLKQYFISFFIFDPFIKPNEMDSSNLSLEECPGEDLDFTPWAGPHPLPLGLPIQLEELTPPMPHQRD